MLSRILCSTDAFTYQTSPTTNYGISTLLSLNGSGAAGRRSYLFAPRPFPLGATIVSAVVKTYLGMAWAGGPHTITAKRITSTWRESTITWSVAPTVTVTNAGTEAVTAGTLNQLVEIDVTSMMQDVAAGNTYYGIRLELDTVGVKNMYSSEHATTLYRPILEVTWTIPPKAPTDLAPTEGGVVALESPFLQWTFASMDATAQQNKYQVQVDDVDDFATPVWDSGWVTDPSTVAEVGIALADGVTRYWRVRVQDQYGMISPWSVTRSLVRQDKDSLVIDEPGATVEQTSPPVAWTFGGTQEAYRVALRDNTQGGYAYIYDSGIIASAVATHEIPSGYITKTDADAYTVIVQIWDDYDRVAQPGDPVYTQAGATFSFDYSAVPDPVDAFTATPQHAEVLLAWTRTVQPDFFALVVDGEVVKDRLDPADFTVGGDDYEYLYPYAQPNVEHTYEIQAVVTDVGELKHSTGNPTDAATTTPTGTWLIAPDLDLRVVMLGREDKTWTIGDDGQTFYPIGRRDPVRVTTSLRGYEGKISGQLQDWSSYDKDTMKAAFEAMKGDFGASEIRLIVQDFNIPVGLENIDISPTGTVGYAVSAGFFQVGEYSIELS